MKINNILKYRHTIAISGFIDTDIVHRSSICSECIATNCPIAELLRETDEIGLLLDVRKCPNYRIW